MVPGAKLVTRGRLAASVTTGWRVESHGKDSRTMCDACDQLGPMLEHAAPPGVDRRTLLRRAGAVGAAAAVAAVCLPETFADAMGPPFESLQLGEDLRPSVAAALQAAAVPAAPAPAASTAKKKKAQPQGSPIGPPHIVTQRGVGRGRVDPHGQPRLRADPQVRRAPHRERRTTPATRSR